MNFVRMYACIFWWHLCHDTRICLITWSTQTETESSWRSEVLNAADLERDTHAVFNVINQTKKSFFLFSHWHLLAFASCNQDSCSQQGSVRVSGPRASCIYSGMVETTPCCKWQQDPLSITAHNSPLLPGKN